MNRVMPPNYEGRHSNIGDHLNQVIKVIIGRHETRGHPVSPDHV